MIKLCIFDMGGVVVQNIQCQPQILDFLGEAGASVSDPRFQKAEHEHGLGLISEDELWRRYTEISGRPLPPCEGSLKGRFFKPRLDEATVDIILKLKSQGLRVVCGTNTIESHYAVHQQLGQYYMFDHIYASHLMHLSKPDPSFFNYILNTEACQPEEAFFSDDVPGNADAARSLGIAAFTYTGAESLWEQLAGIGITLPRS